MDKSKPKTNPKKKKDNKRIRKISLPSAKVQSRICIDELRQNFHRQISLPKERDIIPIFDPMAKSQESASQKRQKTGLILDEAMNEHFCLWDENFPECPERLNCILRRCQKLNLISECEVIPSVLATLDQIKMVHSESLFDILKESQGQTDMQTLQDLASQYDSIYINQKTFKAALLSAGCSLKLTETILEGKVQNGMALVRPPGHHASLDEFCGYSFFNNVALAAKLALSKCKRVLIVDWDVHHGQGTQRTFYDDPRVLYFSSHRYENGSFWPNLRESDFDYCGSGHGTGYNFNFPLNQTGMRNADFLAYFHTVLLPVAYEFNPEIILISSGYDAALGCPEGKMMLEPVLFAHLTSMLMCLAGGKVAVFLEGGYCMDSLSESAMHTLRALMGKPCPRFMNAIGLPCPSMCGTILNVIHSHRPSWKCLSLQATHTLSEDSESSPRSEMDLLPRHTPEVVFEGNPPPAPGTRFPITDYYPEYSKEETDLFAQELQRLQTGTCLKVAPNRVGLVYDSDMEKHFHVIDKSFPERPARTSEIMKRLAEFGILERVFRLQSRRALRSEVCLVHEGRLLDLLLGLPSLTPRERHALADDFDSVYFNEHSCDAARLAAGSLLQVVDSVCLGECQSGIGVIRPPGHHAEKGTPYGFCFFNNVCIAAKYAIQKYALKKILILDWDIHHGNGIQHCFEDDPSVLYISIHLYKGGDFFPYSKEADCDYVGVRAGRGYNINIPWSKGGMGNGDYVSAFAHIVLPVAYQFDPDLVLVSAGFDAAVNDPLGGCCVTPECFGHLTHLLSPLANGRLILALEGGYNLTSISYCMAMCAKALLGDPLPPLNSKLVPSQAAVDTINQVIMVQKHFWSCFKFQVSLPEATHKPSENPGPTALSISIPSENSDSEFLTPPGSPLPSFPNRDLPVQDTNHKDKSDTSATDALLSDLSAMSLSNSSHPDQSDSLDPSSEGAVGGDTLSQITIAQMLQDEMQLHAVVPLSWCPHLGEVNPLIEGGIDVFGAKCRICNSKEENWQCLTCYQVLCGRYVREHMLEHGRTEGHNIVLSYADLSVWCYGCESYVHNEVLFDARQSAHRSKFGEELPR